MNWSLIMSVFSKKNREESNELKIEIQGLPEKTSFFGKHLHIQGDISGDDDIWIDGKVDGTIDVTGDLTINAPSIINGNIRAKSLTSSGGIQGNIVAMSKVSLDKSANVNGKITTPAISMREGAIFDGEMDMDTDQAKK